MEFENLQAFIAVSEQASFSRAAEKLFITQPAVSKRIAALESELDTRLFDRIGHNISLTEAGRALLPRAQRILMELEDSRRALANLADHVAGPLCFGTSHHIGLHRLPPVLRKYSQTYTDVELDIQFMDSEAACNAVAAGKLELGIVTLPLESNELLHSIPVWDDPLGIVIHKDHPLADERNPEPAMLANYNAILPATGTFTREVLERALIPLGIKLKVSLATNYLETIKMMVSVGLGWSVLPLSMMDKEMCVLIFSEIELQRTLGIVHHTERTLSNAAYALINTLNEFSEQTK